MADIVQIRRGTAAQWTSTNPILADGELGFETDTKKGKLGNGITAWTGLTYSFTGDVPDTVAVQIEAATAKTTPVDADDFGITDSASSNILKKLSWANIKATLKTYFDTLYAAVVHTHVAANITNFNTAALSAAPAETVTTVGSLINSSTDKATPVDADLVAIRNTTGGLLAKVTWANIKATLKAYFDTLYGYLGVPQNSKSAAYTLVLADAGKHILHPSADTTARIWTIPANASVAFPIGTAVTFVNQNGAGVITISITTDTMRLAGAGTTGSRTLAANGVATALKLTSTEWIISGSNLT